MYLFWGPICIFSRSEAGQRSRIRVSQRLTKTAFSWFETPLARIRYHLAQPGLFSPLHQVPKHASNLSRQPRTFPSSTMSARSSTRTRRATVQPQLVRQVKNLPLSILAKLVPFVWKDSPAAVDEQSPKKTKARKRKTKDNDAKTDDPKNDDDTFNPVSGEASSADDDDDEPPTTAKKTTAASGAKKTTTTTEPKTRKTVVKKNTGAASKPAARSAPVLSPADIQLGFDGVKSRRTLYKIRGLRRDAISPDGQCECDGEQQSAASSGTREGSRSLGQSVPTRFIYYGKRGIISKACHVLVMAVAANRGESGKIGNVGQRATK
ncbi:hypothetical protein DFH06DRAFT_1428380 [Mycena polygramma]|nr:hypothetical protein DFH06DRAFT_1428380 [Mycena polygramma]